MTGIERPIQLDTRHLAKHLPNTPQMQRLLRKGLAVHIFKESETLFQVAEAIIEKGEYIGKIRKYDRYGLYFTEVIGYRVSPDGRRQPLYYGEIKIDEHDQYHVIPRTKPSTE
jgi:hypothetical protein